MIFALMMTGIIVGTGVIVAVLVGYFFAASDPFDFSRGHD